MKKPKLYFATKDSDVCYSLGFHILSAPKGTKVLELYEAEVSKVSGITMYRLGKLVKIPLK